MNRQAGWIVALACIVTCAAAGQVRQLPTGQALDRNMQIGSGGYNHVVGGSGGVNAQLIATNQVTGLAGFSGVTLVAPNQLRITPPSAYLDTFLRQSVGVGQAITHTAHSSTAFYSEARTVFDVPRSGGAGLPASYTVAGGSAGASVIERAYSDARRQFDAVLPQAIQAGRQEPLPQQAVFRPEPVVPPHAAFTAVTTEQRQRETLARELLEAQNALRGVNESATDVPPGPNAGGEKTLGDATGELAASTRGGQMVPTRGQDVFVDILMAMKSERENATIPGRNPGEPSIELAPVKPREPGESPVDVEDHTVVIRGLAGASQDMFNQHMVRGQTAMRAGRYYEAAKNFEVAVVLNPANPVALIGQGLAVFAAGEFYSASNTFRRALESFPPIMETRLDMPGMLSKGDFEKRLAELNERAAPEDADTPILLLATFVNYNAGDLKTARAHAARLAERTDIRPIAKLYAEYVQTGEIPKSLGEATPGRR